MAGYYNEITGEWVETGDVGQLPGPLPETTGTGNLPGWTVNNGVWTDPSGATYDLSYLGSSITPGILGTLKNLFSGTSALGPAGQFLAAAGLGKLISNLTGGSGQTGPAGYRGGIPEYTATRTQTPMAQQRPEGYRPGQGGITYFNPIQYEYMGRDLGTPKSVGISAPAPTDQTAPKVPDQAVAAAHGGYMPGGIAMLAAGGGTGSRFLQGPGDGVSDSIPAKFDRSGAPARLADGEFVIDARTVSESVTALRKPVHVSCTP